MMESPSAKMPPQESKTALRPLRVLVVDDHHDCALSLSLLLTVWGHEAHVAYDGEACVEDAERLRPDLVLLDLLMPGMGGLNACRRLRSRSWAAGLVVAAVTGWTDWRLGDLKDAGLNVCIAKPAQIRPLQSLLAAVASKYNGAASER